MPDEPKKLSPEQAQAWQPVIRELIKHENDLVNQRLGWLIQIQGLLFAALAFAWRAAPKPLTALIALMGIATAVSLSTALSLYSPAIRGLRTWWHDHRPDGTMEGPDVIGYWSPSRRVEWYLRPWRALPCIFIAGWVGVLIVLLFSKP